MCQCRTYGPANQANNSKSESAYLQCLRISTKPTDIYLMK